MNTGQAKEHLPLLSWIVQNLRTARDHGPGSPTKIEPSGSEMAIGTGEVVNSLDLTVFDQDSQKKKLLAMEQRKRLMEQISAMQRKFLNAHQQELEEVDVGGNNEALSLIHI